MFLKVLQNSLENTCARVSFLEHLWWLLLLVCQMLQPTFCQKNEFYELSKQLKCAKYQSNLAKETNSINYENLSLFIIYFHFILR